MSTVDVRAIAASRNTLGLATVGMLVDAGISYTTIRRRAADGHWPRVAARLLDITRARWTWKRRVLAAVLAAPEGSAASHVTAAALHGIWERDRPKPIHITVPRGLEVVADKVIRHTTTLGMDVVRASRVPATSVPRTLRDIAATETADATSFAIRAALRLGLTSEARIAAEAETSYPGARRLREGLDLDRSHALRTESWLEDIALPSLARSSLPAFVSQFEMVLSTGRRARADVAWPAAKLSLEALGIKHHSPASRVIRDGDRAAAFRADGWHVEEVMILDFRGVRLERLVALLHSLLAERS